MVYYIATYRHYCLDCKDSSSAWIAIEPIDYWLVRESFANHYTAHIVGEFRIFFIAKSMIKTKRSNFSQCTTHSVRFSFRCPIFSIFLDACLWLLFQFVGWGISMVSLVLGDSLASPTLFMSKSKLLLMIKSDTSLLLVSLLYDLSWKWNIIRKRRHWSLLQRRRESQHHFSMKHSFFWVANKHTVPKMYVECIVSIVIQPDFSLDTMIQ